MKKVATIQISEAGKSIANTLQHELGAKTITRTEIGKHWDEFDAFVFIGAMGICVRTIAPYIKDKHEDPAVVCVDSLGMNAISVLSGHIGGANDLAREVAAVIGAREVITTQSDNAGLWALDTFEKRFGWHVVGDWERGRPRPHLWRTRTSALPNEPMNDMEGGGNHDDAMQSAIFTFVNRQPTALLIEAQDEGTEYLLNTLPPHVTLVNSLAEVDKNRYKLCIVVSPTLQSLEASPTILHFVPRVLTVGIGLAHQAEPANEILAEIYRSIETAGYHALAIDRYCTIDVKHDEPVIRALQAAGETVCFFTADELAKVEVPNPSATVQKHVGTPSVCEAAAILGSNHGKLIVPKVKGRNWTAAVAQQTHPQPLPTGRGVDSPSAENSQVISNYSPPYREGQGGGSAHIEIVGAGPGDPDLVSVRGRKMLERADLILYAGSLVPKALTECHKPGAVVRSSADMNLEEQCALMKEHYDRGHFIVRLHTGDPCIFGAIQEQMAFFDANGMDYHITPGISSFLAAAAELQSQFTIPERCQTIILTRGEGRTPMPEKEQLHLLARSQSTMCIFLSASIVDDVQRELLMEYPEDTPVAACYHLTWPDQKIYRGVLKDLAKIVHDNHLTLTTMLVVGEAIDNREGLSALYDKHFTHLFRKGTAPPGSADVTSALGTRSSTPAIIADETSALPGAGEDDCAPRKDDCAPRKDEHSPREDDRAPKELRAWHSRGYLPHVEDKQLQSITFRLFDSVPADIITRWKEEADRDASGAEEAKIRQAIADYEDKGYGECFLKDCRVAEIVQNALLYYDGVRYRLIRWCVMPNHVHVLIEMNGEWSLSSILKGWKSFTAHEANKMLGRKGNFWMQEYFDRYIRNERHFQNVVQYIDNNPVKAGLVSSPEEWPWSTLGARTSRPQ